MKTIKQLEKEIEELNIQHGIHTGISVKECSDNNCIDKPRLRLLEAKLKTLQEVCKEIDKQIKNYQKLNKKFPKNQTFVDMWTSLFALQLRLEGEE